MNTMQEKADEEIRDMPKRGPVLQYLSFDLGDAVCAMDIRNVREIIQYGAITVVPQMPAFVRGVINLRGAVVPVIDLQVRFALPRATIGKKTCVIILDVSQEDGKVPLGLMVDAVSEVIDIAQDQTEAPPQFGTAIPPEFISAIARVEDRFIVLIDPARALDIEEMSALAG